MSNFFKKETTNFSGIVTNQTVRATNTLGKAASITEKNIKTYVAPVRDTVFKRFPTLFSLLVTFGVVATFLGMEKIIEQSKFLDDSPWLILTIGVSILFLTGKLYKKLG
jgi:uncharacterized integral membrane protein